MSIRANKVKQRLAAGQVATILSGTNDPDLIDQLGPLGADGIWLEGEHGGVDYADLGNLTRACDLWGMTSVVRVNALHYGTIYRCLDLGAQAICVPHTKLLMSFTSAPLPVGPRWVTDFAMTASTGCTRSRTSGDPPTRKLSSPAPA